MDLLNQLNEGALQDLQLVPTMINLALVLVLGQILAWHYLTFSQVLSNKRKFARLFVLLAATTMMVISVVKTSLALSLGLVGALSIIRFRTPIKEPEDLSYLFLALATGIGIGADQRAATVLMFAGILGVLTITNYFRRRKDQAPRVYASVSTPLTTADNETLTTESGLDVLLAKVREAAISADLRRVDSQEGMLNVTLILDLVDVTQIGSVMGRIQSVFPQASVSVVEGASLD
ncbi:DUF4956 domain-containing protein [Acanthopleuribacter pedis]|uniref:DUF4956 domain-containing protein n=1 Tax=Acanthopleuribacter pedis TaxID=442870 RepID=A0A8J7Q1X3_9BACT|nr:DUF4956 domain-containing protein [Acanthopleuribacter pedis]MBO1317760.1 DUF4956 domain-containing protein [Acanthopleuribacter pedis]